VRVDPTHLHLPLPCAAACAVRRLRGGVARTPRISPAGRTMASTSAARRLPVACGRRAVGVRSACGWPVRTSWRAMACVVIVLELTSACAPGLCPRPGSPPRAFVGDHIIIEPIDEGDKVA